jgi:hypothetical protein
VDRIEPVEPRPTWIPPIAPERPERGQRERRENKLREERERRARREPTGRDTPAQPEEGTDAGGHIDVRA